MTNYSEYNRDASTINKQYEIWTIPSSYSCEEFGVAHEALGSEQIEDQYQISRAWTLVGPDSILEGEYAQIGQREHIRQAEAQGGASVVVELQPVESLKEWHPWSPDSELRKELVIQLKQAAKSIEIEAEVHSLQMLMITNYIVHSIAEKVATKPNLYEMPDSGIVADYSNDEDRLIIIIEDENIDVMAKTGEHTTNTRASLTEVLSNGISSYIPSL